MSINIEQVVSGMLGAAKDVVGQKWPQTRDYFESEARSFAQRLASIEMMHTKGMISDERARSHVQFQKEAWETVLIAVDGLTQLLVEEALNAAINAVKELVNGAIGFVLL